MNQVTFFKSLGVVALATAAFLGLLHSVAAPIQPHWRISIISIVLFTVVCIGLYYAGINTLRSKSKVAFNGVVSVSVFGKMVLTMLTLFLYQQSVHPPNQWFVGIFLLVYVVFTVYEVWFMSKLAKGGAG
jgi:hypothetical protein